jgi:hypothetical protein
MGMGFLIFINKLLIYKQEKEFYYLFYISDYLIH